MFLGRTTPRNLRLRARGGASFEILFDLLQGASLGLRHDAEEEDAYDAEDAVQPGGARLRDRVDQGEYRGSYDEVEHPVGDASRGRALAAYLEREHLGVEQPDADPERGGERGDGAHKTGHEDELDQGGLGRQEVSQPEHDEVQRHARGADEEQWPAPHPVDGEQGRASHQAFDEPDTRRGQDRTGLP